MSETDQPEKGCSCEETRCPAREDALHCVCWYDGLPCCACEAAACNCDH